MSLKIRILSSFLVLSFCLEQISFAAPDLKPKVFDLFEKPIVHLNLPESVASIEDTWKSPDSDKLVYLIQDAHTNDSGQLNLAKTLDVLLKEEKGLKYIFAEGAVGDNSLSFLRKADFDKRKEVSSRYLKKGLLHGAEYLDLTSEREFVIWGVENIDLYLKSLESYRYVAKNREKFQDYLKRIDQTIGTLKSRIYNPLLSSFEEKQNKFLKEEISLTEYFDALVQQAKNQGIDLNSYPHLKALKNLKDKEESVDFKKANEEQVKAIQNLSPEDKKELLEVSKEESPFKLGSAEHNEKRGFYALLEEKLKDKTVNFPNLSKYFDYLKESKNLNPRQVLEEQKSLERESLRLLTKTEDERSLLRCQSNLRFLQKLFNLTLTPEEYREYKTESQDFQITHLTGFLNKKIMDLKKYYERAIFLEEGYQPIVKSSEEFYKLTKDRDEAFLKNMFSKMGAESQTKSVLITGGFHTPSLKALLKERNVSYICLTPQVTHETNQKRYEGILLNQEVSPALLQNTFTYSSAKMDILYALTALKRAITLSQEMGLERDVEVQKLLQGPRFTEGAVAERFEATTDQTRFMADRALMEALKFAATYDEVDRALKAHENIYHTLRVEQLFPVGLGARLAEQPFVPNQEELKSVGQFLANNVTDITGMPLSYKAPQGYWQNHPDTVDGVMERLLTANGLNIYDGMTWAMTQVLMGNTKLSDDFIDRLSRGSSGRLHNIRTTEDDVFEYGDKRLKFPREQGFFYRMISDRWEQEDPKYADLPKSEDDFDKNPRRYSFPGFPNNDKLHHEDWMPIAGENAWVVLGAVQIAYLKYGKNIPLNSKEIKLALSLIPAIEAMQSPIGAIYHAPKGTFGKDPRNVSNENNFSMYSALRMLYQVVGSQDSQTASRIKKIMDGQEAYFKKYIYDKSEGVFYQGGFVVGNSFRPAREFAVDVQTWGMAVLGLDWIVRNIGNGDQEIVRKIWQNTKKRAGYFEDGVIRGVGFTDGHDVFSSEWSLGAVQMLRQMVLSYRKAGITGWSQEMEDDADSIRYGVEKLRVTLPDGSIAYKYSNKRTWIPFGWWGNPIPSTAGSTWTIMVDKGFDPFILGGGKEIIPQAQPQPSSSKKPEVIKEETPKEPEPKEPMIGTETILVGAAIGLAVLGGLLYFKYRKKEQRRENERIQTKNYFQSLTDLAKRFRTLLIQKIQAGISYLKASSKKKIILIALISSLILGGLIYGGYQWYAEDRYEISQPRISDIKVTPELPSQPSPVAAQPIKEIETPHGIVVQGSNSIDNYGDVTVSRITVTDPNGVEYLGNSNSVEFVVQGTPGTYFILSIRPRSGARDESYSIFPYWMIKKLFLVPESGEVRVNIPISEINKIDTSMQLAYEFSVYSGSGEDFFHQITDGQVSEINKIFSQEQKRIFLKQTKDQKATLVRVEKVGAGARFSDSMRQQADKQLVAFLKTASTFKDFDEALSKHEKIYDRLKILAENELSGLIGARMSVQRRDFIKTLGFSGGALITNPLALFAQTPLAPFKANPEQMKAIAQFLAGNVTESGMPLSYKATQADWQKLHAEEWQRLEKARIQKDESVYPDVDLQMERMIAQYGIVVYDGMIWAMALALMGRTDLSDKFIARLLSGRSGNLSNIRAGDDYFNHNGKELSHREGLYFRIITDKYENTDPLTGTNKVSPQFPNYSNVPRLHWEDWKSILGENAWVILGAVQMALIKYKDKSKIPLDSPEMKLALSLLTALEAMQSPIGALYHAPKGTVDKQPNEVSNENNFSAYSALSALLEVVKGRDNSSAERIQKILKGQEEYFAKYLYDKSEGVFYQGGFVVGNNFRPAREFAVDVQTWGISVLGAEWINQNIGQGKEITSRIWEETKKRAGFFKNGRLLGVGFTDGHDVFSSEWSFGAVHMLRRVALEYDKKYPEIAKKFSEDANNIRHGIENELKVQTSRDSVSYLYSNIRNYIPFGWWGNPIPATAGAAWSIFVDSNFDPFTLGGKTTIKQVSIVAPRTSAPREEITKLQEEKEIELGGGKGVYEGDNGAFSNYLNFRDGNVDFSNAKFVSVTIRGPVGTLFRVRLLPDGASPGSSTGATSAREEKLFTIPSDGQITIKIPIEDFGLSVEDLKAITQLSVHSGTAHWTGAFKKNGQTQTADKQARIVRVAMIVSGARATEVTNWSRRRFNATLLKGVGAIGTMLAASKPVGELPIVSQTSWDENNSILNLLVQGNVRLDDAIRQYAIEQRPYIDFSPTLQQMSVLIEAFKKDNPVLRNTATLPNNSVVNMRGVYRELLVMDILEKSETITSQKFTMEDQNVEIHFVRNNKHKHLESGAATISLTDREVVFIDVDQLSEEARKIQNPETAMERFYAETYQGRSLEEVFISLAYSTLAHELAHAMTNKGISRGVFNSSLLAENVVEDEIRRIRQFSPDKRIYRVKEELAAILGELSFSQNAKGDLNKMRIASYGSGGDYISATGITIELLFNALGFSDYLSQKGSGGKILVLPKTHKEWARDKIPPQKFGDEQAFIESLKDDNINQEARKFYERFFGKLPSQNFIRVPQEVIHYHLNRVRPVIESRISGDVIRGFLLPTAFANPEKVSAVKEAQITILFPEGAQGRLESYGLKLGKSTSGEAVLLVRQEGSEELKPVSLKDVRKNQEGHVLSVKVSVSDLVTAVRGQDSAISKAVSQIADMDTTKDVVLVFLPELLFPNGSEDTSHFDIFVASAMQNGKRDSHLFVMLEPNGNTRLLEAAGTRLAELKEKSPRLANRLSKLFVTATILGAAIVHVGVAEAGVANLIPNHRYVPVRAIQADELPSYPVSLFTATGRIDIQKPLDNNYKEAYRIAQGGTIQIEDQELKTVIDGTAPVQRRIKYAIVPLLKALLADIRQVAKNLLAIGSSA